MGKILRRLSQFILNFSVVVVVVVVVVPTEQSWELSILLEKNFPPLPSLLLFLRFASPILLAIFEVSEIFWAVPHIGQPAGQTAASACRDLSGEGGVRPPRRGRFYIIKGTLPDWKRGIKPNQPWS